MFNKTKNEKNYVFAHIGMSKHFLDILTKTEGHWRKKLFTLYLLTLFVHQLWSKYLIQSLLNVKESTWSPFQTVGFVLAFQICPLKAHMVCELTLEIKKKLTFHLRKYLMQFHTPTLFLFYIVLSYVFLSHVCRRVQENMGQVFRPWRPIYLPIVIPNS